MKKILKRSNKIESHSDRQDEKSNRSTFVRKLMKTNEKKSISTSGLLKFLLKFQDERHDRLKLSAKRKMKMTVKDLMVICLYFMITF